jgi:hypothetical protein
VLAHQFWLERLGGDPNVVGTTLQLDGKNDPTAVSPPSTLSSD